MKRALVALALVPACFRSHGGESTHCRTDRPVELGLQEDVTKVTGCEQLAGLTIKTGAPIDVTPLKDLEEITGDLSIGPTIGLDEAAFNGLLKVGGTIRVMNNGSLRGLFFPRLEHVGRFQVENNAVLASISLPRLADVQGAMVVADNGSLELVSAPLLATVGKELVIAGQGRLDLLELPHLTSVEAIRIEGNPKLAPEVVEQLTSKSALGKPPTP